MRAMDIMHRDPITCGPETNLREVARLMCDGDCGAIPVIDIAQGRPLGIVTDRDIVCRTIAANRNPADVLAMEIMSSPVVAVMPEDDIDECREAMEKFQVRRLIVLDDEGALAGVVTQAQLARVLPTEKSGQILKRVSRKTDHASRVAVAPGPSGRP